MSMITVGTCGLCGGPVQISSMWGSSIPQEMKCSRCGAVAERSFGPIIPMRSGKKSEDEGEIKRELFSGSGPCQYDGMLAK